MIAMLNLRLAEPCDMENVFNLSNDDSVRQNSIHTEKIIWENHIKWYKDKINSPDSIFYIAEENSKFIGYCRLDRENDFFVVTIHILPSMRKKGYGKKIIKDVCNLNKNNKFIAFVKESNIASYKMFLDCKFQLVNMETINNNNYYKLQYDM